MVVVKTQIMERFHREGIIFPPSQKWEKVSNMIIEQA
jgi:hypothetical protein